MNHIFKPVFVLTALLLILSCAPGRKVEKQLENTFSKTADTNPWVTGIMIYDPASREVIFEHHSNKYFIPASTTKLFSFYTGLKLLKDSVPALQYFSSNDTLYFSGTGDPTFLHKDFDSSKILKFLKSRPEVLVLVPPAASEKAFGPGWAWDDYNYGFSAERSSFPIYGNVVSFQFSSKDSLKVYPPFFKDHLEIDSRKQASGVQRLQKENRFKFAIFDTSTREQNIPFITSEELSAKLLADTLHRQVLLKNTPPKNVLFEQKLFSQPLDSIYKKMLQDSDNFMAEQLLLLAAGEISDSLNSKIVIDYMKANYLKELPHEIKWVDGSGLSRYNLFTPRSMVWVLNRIFNEVPQERLFALLPAGGVTGTLKNDYKAPPGKPPFVYAKTGTLSNNHSLSGYLVTASGKVLVFSYMNNNYLVSPEKVKSEMDRVLRTLYLNY